MNILFPPGRMVFGDPGLARPVIDDQTRQQKSDKNGQPLFDYTVGVAIPKQGEQHWNQTPWGADVFATANAAWMGGETQRPTFSWKIVDGDCQQPNENNRIPAQQEGYPGNWVIAFSAPSAPALRDNQGFKEVPKETFYPGCFVQVMCTIKSNGAQRRPGMYMNPQAVAFSAHGERIAKGVDTTSMGFGQGPLPSGASEQPLGNDNMQQQQQQPAQQQGGGYQPAQQQQPAQQGGGYQPAQQQPAQQGGGYQPQGQAEPGNASYPQVLNR